jgi:metal-responsive CopG/Arc/MetJ family transcriptional regulator
VKTVSVKLTDDLARALNELARRRTTSRSAVVREALAKLTGRPKGSVTAVAGTLVGSLQGPRDLATSRKHMAGYGE